LFLAVAFGFVIDNHWIRLDPSAPDLARLPAGPHFEDWNRANPYPYWDRRDREPSLEGKRPMVLVAAAGGGIRAAYWTATTLATMEQVPGFSESLFAISGVSGGSVGAAMYAAIKRNQLDSSEQEGQRGALDTARSALGQDFLSPVVAGMLFPDLIQRFIPFSVQWFDRQRYLEIGFERSLGGQSGPLSRSFTALYANGYEYRLPALLFNTTVVDSGRRAVVSNIALEGFTDTADLLGEGFSTRAIKLSAAAGASARFTYVSPAGSLCSPRDRTASVSEEGGQCQHGSATWSPEEGDSQKIRLVDGGYFENSGAATVMDLLNQIGNESSIYPILVLIRNDPQAPPVCKDRPGSSAPGFGPAGPPADNAISEVASPVRALLNSRTARGRLAEVDAAKQVEQRGGAVIEVSLAAVAEAAMQKVSNDERARIRRQLVEPPLGWSLSAATRKAMDDALDGAAKSLAEGIAVGDGCAAPVTKRSVGLARELWNLRAILGGCPTQYVACDAR
jgi:hypothetical protein